MGAGVKTSVQNLAQWTEQLEAVITPILASPIPSDIGQRALQATMLTDKMLHGVDPNDDGIVEPLAGEGGMEVAYEQAYRMADMPLEAVGILNIGTGTPTFVLVAPSSTPGGGGAGGSTANPTPKTNPGQQRTAKPPPGQQKTKVPKNNTGASSNTTTTNNGNGNGNEK